MLLPVDDAVHQRQVLCDACAAVIPRLRERGTSRYRRGPALSLIRLFGSCARYASGSS